MEENLDITPVLYSHDHRIITSTKSGASFFIVVVAVVLVFDSAPGLEVMQDAALRKRLNIGGCYSSPCGIFTVWAELRCLFWIYAGCLRGGTTGAERKISQRSASPSFSGAAVYLAGSKERRRLGGSE